MMKNTTPRLTVVLQRSITKIGLSLPSLLTILFGVLIGGLPAKAEIPDVIPPFPVSQTWEPGTLIHKFEGVGGRITFIGYHNGRIYSYNLGGGGEREWQWQNANDITSITETLNENDGDDVGIPVTSGTHGSYKVNNWLGNNMFESPGVTGKQGLSEEFKIGSAGGSNLDTIYYPWKTQFTWNQYGDDGSARLIRGGDILAEMNTLETHGVGGISVLMGNLLLVVSDRSFQGILAYDISPVFNDPAGEPVLIDKLSGTLGTYLPHIWQNYICLNVNGEVTFVDYSDPSNLRVADTVQLQNANGAGGQSNSYFQGQDEFIFIDGNKINMETFTVDLVLDEDAVNRPAGSELDPLDTSQYMMPMGQFLVTGSYFGSTSDGIGLWSHQSTPDTQGPYVGYHVPQDGQANYPVGAPISVAIAENLESYTIINKETVIVRPVGETDPANYVDCIISFTHNGVMTITPKNYLAEETTYEVIFVEDGIKDVMGNGMEPYSFVFSTDDTAVGGNQGPVINDVVINSTPATPGSTINFSIAATDPGTNPDPLEYRMTYGDGTSTTAWQSSENFSNTYANAGHYEVKFQVRDLKPGGASSVTTELKTITIAPAISGPSPASSSQLAMDTSGGGRKLWVVNPDNGTVSTLDAGADPLVPLNEYDLESLSELEGREADPRNVAIDSAGQVWISCFTADKVVVLNASDGSLVEVIDTGYGSRPFGVVASPDGNAIYVTTEGRGHDADGDPATGDAGNGQLIRFDTTRAETGRVELGPIPRAIAVSGDGGKVLVGRFISGPNYGEIWEIDASQPGSLALTDTIELLNHQMRDESSSNGSGVPNYIHSITISPDGDWAWYSAVKANVNDGTFFVGSESFNNELSPENTVRAMVGRIDLATNTEPDIQNSSSSFNHYRLDIDNSDSPTGIAFSARNDYAFVALQGNNEVAVFDNLRILEGPKASNSSTAWRIDVEAAPQSLLLDEVSGRLFVKNFMSRSVSAVPVSGFLSEGARSSMRDDLITVAEEELGPRTLQGKQIFYLADDDRMSSESYISCATCHTDGMEDGRVWDFTQRGEGLRNTIDLRGRGGMEQGNVHWSGNFDEIEDFELDMANHFGGSGFLATTGGANSPLDAPNARRDRELDNLALYVASLKKDTLPASPYRDSDGGMTSKADNGAQIFQAQNCIDCHNPADDYTDSVVARSETYLKLHDVGTLRTSSGKRLNSTLNGIDTPTLLGIWATAPYFHDGSAPGLEDVFTVAGGINYQAEDATRVDVGLTGNSNFNLGDSVTNSSYGRAASFGTTGGTATFDAVEGGSADGTGAIELRVNGDNQQSELEVEVNGQVYGPFQVSGIGLTDWQPLRVENVPLTAGATNTVIVRRTGSNRFYLDQIVVGTPGELAKAQAHRVALGLSPSDREDLVAYLQQLDGRDGTGALPAIPESTEPIRAYDDLTETSSGSDVTIDVLLNDAPEAGLSIESYTNGQAGTVSLTNGMLTYSPTNPEFRGTDSFTYTATDGAVTDSALVTVKVGGEVAGDDQFLTINLSSGNVGFGDNTFTLENRSGGDLVMTGRVWAASTQDGTVIDILYDPVGGNNFTETWATNVSIPYSPDGNKSSQQELDMGATITIPEGETWNFQVQTVSGGQLVSKVFSGQASNEDLTLATSKNATPFGQIEYRVGTIDDLQPAIDPVTLADAEVGSAYQSSPTATGGNAPLRWSLGPLAPLWLEIDEINGELTGTPGSGDAGTFHFNIWVTDFDGDTASAPATLTVHESSGSFGPPQLLTLNLQDGNAGISSPATFTVENTSGSTVSLTGRLWAAASSGGASIDIDYDPAGGTNFSQSWATALTVPYLEGANGKAQQVEITTGSTIEIPAGGTINVQVSVINGNLVSKYFSAQGASDANLNVVTDQKRAIVGQIEYQVASGGGAVLAEFTDHPDSQTVYAGQSLTFSVAATGSPAPSFEWFKDGNPLASSGETLFIPNAALADAGDYTAVASNDAGDVTSDAATLAVIADSGLPGMISIALGTGDVYVSRQLAGGGWEQATDAGGIDGDGNGIDALIYDYQSIAGDFVAVVNLQSLTGPNGSRAGLMLREDSNADGNPASGDRLVFLGSQDNSATGYVQQARLTIDAAADPETVTLLGGVALPDAFPDKWLMIVRTGDAIDLYTSSDGVNYELVDAGYTLPALADDVTIGLAAWSGNLDEPAVAVFDAFDVTAVNDPVLLELDLRDGNAGIGSTAVLTIENTSGAPVTLSGRIWAAASPGDATIDVHYDPNGGTNFSQTWATNVAVPYVMGSNGKSQQTEVDLGSSIQIPSGTSVAVRVITVSGGLVSKYWSSQTVSDADVTVTTDQARAIFGQIEYVPGN